MLQRRVLPILALAAALAAPACGSGDDASTTGASSEGCPSCPATPCKDGEQDMRTCEVPGGTGSQSRTCKDGSFPDYGQCDVSKCDPAYQLSKDKCVPATNVIVVSPHGNDSTGDGTILEPYKSIEKAQSVVQGLIAKGKLPKGGLTVYLRAGVYGRSTTLTFGTADAGTAESPIVWAGYPGEDVSISGGQSLEPSWFSAVTSATPLFSRLAPKAAGKIVVADLKAHGITDYGELTDRGFQFQSDTAPSHLELFVDAAPMDLARWPNKGQIADPSLANEYSAQSITVVGDATPNVGGTYALDGTANNAPVFKRQGLVGSDQYYIYINWIPNDGGSVWYLSTSRATYPGGNGKPFWADYSPFNDSKSPAGTHRLAGFTSAYQGAGGTPLPMTSGAVGAGYTLITNEVSNGSTGQFSYDGSNPAHWADPSDAWLYAFPFHFWADLHVRVGSIDAGAQSMTMAFDSPTITGPVYGIRPSGAFYAYNVLEELDTPGEYYLDRSSGLLYLYPPSDLSKADIEVSMMSAPLVAFQGEAAFITVEGLALEYGRATLVTIGDTSNPGVHDVTLDTVELCHGGTYGALVYGTSNGVRNSEVFDLGDGGIKLYGGDKPTLTPAGNFADNNDIHDYARWDQQYRPAIEFGIGSVGNRALHNEIHDAPQQAFQFSGAAHVMAYNDIHDVLKVTDDAGAIYAYQDWTTQGTSIAYNYIHDLTQSGVSGRVGIVGLYYDGGMGGVTSRGNILDTIHGIGMLMNGGRDFVTVNNVVVKCDTAFDIPAYGSSIIGNNAASIAAVDYQSPPWSVRYPDLALVPPTEPEMIAGHWYFPRNIVLSRNAGDGDIAFERIAKEALTEFANQAAYDAFDPNVCDFADHTHEKASVKPLLVHEPGGKVEIDASSPALAIPGFEPIPVKKIGIQKGSWSVKADLDAATGPAPGPPPAARASCGF